MAFTSKLIQSEPYGFLWTWDTAKSVSAHYTAVQNAYITIHMRGILIVVDTM